MDPSFLGDLTPLDTYLYYEGPRCYSSKHDGRLFYCHQCDESLEYDSFFVREASPDELELLEENKITMRDFLVTACPLYVVQIGRSHFKVFQVEPSDFAEDHFPEQGAYLSWDG